MNKFHLTNFETHSNNFPQQIISSVACVKCIICCKNFDGITNKIKVNPMKEQLDLLGVFSEYFVCSNLCLSWHNILQKTFQTNQLKKENNPSIYERHNSSSNTHPRESKKDYFEDRKKRKSFEKKDRNNKKRVHRDQTSPPKQNVHKFSSHPNVVNTEEKQTVNYDIQPSFPQNNLSPTKNLFFVVDTNILLNSFQKISQVSDPNVKFIVPSVVLRELDGLKNKKEIKEKTYRAIHWIHNNSTADHSQNKVMIQNHDDNLSPNQIKFFFPNSFNNDDKILACAVHFNFQKTPYGDKVVLLTNDTILKIKANSVNILSSSSVEENL